MTKKELRLEIQRLINELEDEYITQSNELIFEKLISLPAFINAERVFLYSSIGREVDTQKLINFCLQTGKGIFLPRTFPGGRMDFCPVADISALVVKKPYNILEPPEGAAAAAPTERDIILVPALCFDEELFRLGHGGGYYDRYLSGCAAPSLGLSLERFVFPAVPRNGFDLPVDALLTEKKLRNR